MQLYNFFSPNEARKNFSLTSFLSFAPFVLSACVLPPDKIEPRVINPQELAVVSAAKRGSDLALSGRMDLAEAQYRSALLLEPQSPVLLNDLGFVLYSQNRLVEAKSIFAKTIKLAPDNLAARDNLARLYYREGDYLAAIREYQGFIDTYFRIAPRQVVKLDPTLPAEQQVPPPDPGAPILLPVYRNLAILYNLVGLSGEGVCYGERALALEDPSYGETEHGRLLLTIERTDLAIPFYRRVIAEKGEALAPSAYFDYGLALYLEGNLDLAKQAFVRISLLPDSQPIERLAARVLRVLIARRQNDTTELDTLIEAAQNEESSACSIDEIGDTSYWPQPIQDDVIALFTELCREKSSSFFSS